ncbi:EamA family transporter [Zafaria sp. J156]|uniref:EamA family transporter n=1 Tax=Zafaria sp. J156 TaxID=3116490 RepID=UPI002E793F66|nr:EamA family transporter [Zafaria sp. J156]MEE1621045.1 EamA family transporter [Zafaria sp. J156]
MASTAPVTLQATPRPSLRGIWIALFSSAVFGISGSFAKPLLEAGWTSGAAVGARMSGAALVLLIPTLFMLRGRWGSVLANWRPILLFGVFGVGICQFAYFQAVERLSVGVALLLEYLAPVLIVLTLWVRTRRRPRGLTIAGAALSLGGLVLVLDLTGAQRVDPVGVLWGLGAAVGLAVYFFITAKANDTLPPLVLATGGLFVGAVLMLLLGAARLLPMRAVFGQVEFSGFALPWWAALGGLVLMATVLAYVSGIMAARALGTKLASFVSLTEVLFAVLWAWLLLQELPAAIQLLGGALIVLGVLLVRADELRSVG